MIFQVDPGGFTPVRFSARLGEDGAASAVAQLADGSIVLVRREVEVNLFTEETTETWVRHELPGARPLTALLMDADQLNVYGGTASGELLWWRIAGKFPGNFFYTVSIPTRSTQRRRFATMFLKLMSSACGFTMPRANR